MTMDATPESTRPGRRKLAAAVISSITALLIGGLITGSATAGPNRPAVIQLDWVVGLMNDSSPPTADGLRRHFAPGFLKAVSREQLLSALYPAWSERPVTVRRIRNEQSIGAVATLATRGASFQVTVTVELTGSHRIIGLMLQPVAPKLTSWRSIDQSLSRLGRHVALYVGSPGGRTIHAMNASDPLAVGSAFKLYVLGALAQAVEQGRFGWQQQLAISDAHK